MLLPKLVERVLPNTMKLQMLAAVDLRWREVRDAFVVMSIIVPIECDRTPVLPLVESHSPIWPRGSVLQGFELRFGVRVVVARAWSRMRLRDVEFRKALRERPRCHRGERAGFGGGKSPSNNAPAVEVDDDIEVVVAADGGGQFRDVPSPDLVWSRRTKSWNRCLGMRRDSPTFSNRLVLSQYSIHRSD